jgi:hypothetical protein
MSTTERHPLHVNLRRLAELHGPDRAFVSIYLSGPESLSGLPDRMARIESLLDDQPDELEHFRRSMEMAQTWLAGHDVVEPGACVFACWPLDFIEGHALPVKVEDRLRIDSSPFIWPLAEIFDEYESYVVIVADNSRARLLLVRTAVPSEEDTVRGDVKNRVKKGGWSQQRYARRREKQLEQYVKEIVDGLASLDEQHTFGRVILLGGKETLEAIEAQLPPALADKVVGRKGVDVTDADQSKNIPNAARRTEHGKIGYSVAVIIARRGNVFSDAPMCGTLLIQCRTCRIPPSSGRRSVNCRVGCAVAVEVAGQRFIACRAESSNRNSIPIVV